MGFKGLYTLVLEKKGIFTIFFWKNNFFLKTASIYFYMSYSDSSYKYFILKKFIKDFMTCKNK